LHCTDPPIPYIEQFSNSSSPMWIELMFLVARLNGSSHSLLWLPYWIGTQMCMPDKLRQRLKLENTQILTRNGAARI